MDYLPIFCQLQQKRCLLVGAGKIAENKARLLIAAGADVIVNAKTFNSQFEHWVHEQQLTLIKGEFNETLLDQCWLVIAATDDPLVNQQVRQSAERQRIFCNVVDMPDQASFIMPAIIDRSPLMIAISTKGNAPVLARLIRTKLEALLPPQLGRLVHYAGQLRQQIKERLTSKNARRHFWENFFNHDRLSQAIAGQDTQQIKQLTNDLLQQSVEQRGEVILVGAGPGDAGLLTLKGLQQIQQADVVVYDRLVSNEVLQLVRRDAERIFVGKRPGCHCVSQTEINQILLHETQLGKRVVRLKGGDPLIFGRGGEELALLNAANIPVSIVPGITAASGCAAYTGIPLTHRDYAQGIQIITGHLKNNASLDWQNLAVNKQTLIIYMALSQVSYIQDQLIVHGMAEQMPVALIENGTQTTQRFVTGQLKQLAYLALQFTSPTLIIIGEVIKLRKNLKI